MLGAIRRPLVRQKEVNTVELLDAGSRTHPGKNIWAPVKLITFFFVDGILKRYFAFVFNLNLNPTINRLKLPPKAISVFRYVPDNVLGIGLIHSDGMLISLQLTRWVQFLI